MPIIQGTGGNDLIAVPGGNSNLTGYTIYGISGDDTLIGGGGADRLFAGNSGNSYLDGGNGNDQLIGSFGDDILLGGNGDDRVFGGLGNDFIDGGAGNDFLVGDLGDDQIAGGDGKDRLFGGLGNDILDGGAGDDNLDGSLGDDQVIGGDGNDTMTAGPGNDLVVGGFGSDIITGGSNAATGVFELDQLIGGSVDNSGNIVPDGTKDLFVLGDAKSSFYAQGGDADYAVIFDFEAGVDQLVLSPVGSHFSTSDGGGNTLVFNVAPNTTNLELIAALVGVNPSQLPLPII